MLAQSQPTEARTASLISRKEAPERPRGSISASSFVLHYANATVCGTKVWELVANMKEEEKPHAFGIVEAHLMGADLNAARRRFASLGWKTSCTPAVPKLVKDIGPALSNGTSTSEAQASESVLKKFQNSGGEILLRLAGPCT